MVRFASDRHFKPAHPCDGRYNTYRNLLFIKGSPLLHMKLNKAVDRLRIPLCSGNMLYRHAATLEHFSSRFSFDIQILRMDVQLFSAQGAASQKSTTKPESFFIGKDNNFQGML